VKDRLHQRIALNVAVQFYTYVETFIHPCLLECPLSEIFRTNLNVVQALVDSRLGRWLQYGNQELIDSSKELIQSLLDAGVPSNGCSIGGRTALDIFIRQQTQFCQRSISDCEMSFLQQILSSGGSISSFAPDSYDNGILWSYFAMQAARRLFQIYPEGRSLNG
jgi:hypothetical protein